MTKPESIESLLSPSLRVSRPVAACARCRSAKIKCDGKLPACSACERSGKGTSCSSANDEFARGKERSYVAALEAAAERLQRKVDQAKMQAASGHPSQASQLLQRPVQSRRISGARRREATDVDELVSDFGFLTVNATSRDFHGFTATMSFAKLLLTAALKQELPRMESGGLPPRYAITPMVNHYLENIYPLFPFFSETDLMASLSRIYQEPSIAISAEPLDVWNIRLILAISYASTSQRKGDDNDRMAIQHVTAARSLASYVLHPGSIAGVQALLLLVQYSLVDPAHFDSWYLIGMASRLVVDLGLHCEPPPETRMSRLETDLRRRIFYCAYAFDRLISMALDRAFSFSDDSAAEVNFPQSTSETGSASSQLFLRSTKPSLYLFDIRRVQSTFYQTTRWSSRSQWPLATAATYASSVSNDIHAWYATIPTDLSAKHIVLFNLERLYCQILVVSPNQRVLASSMTDLNRELVFEYSAQFADQLEPVTQDVSWHAYLTYADICRAQYVGQKFLEVLWSDFDRLLKTTHAICDQSTSTGPLDNVHRATECLGKIIRILDFANVRWGLPQMRKQFEKESAVLFSRLKSRQAEFAPAQATASVSPPIASNQGARSGPLEYYPGPGQYGFEEVPFAQVPGAPFATSVSGSGSGSMAAQQILTPPEDYSQGYNYPATSLPRRKYEFYGGPKR